MYRSTNGRASLAEPEVWFRIVHVAVPARARAGHACAGGDGADGAPVAAPACAALRNGAAGKGAFENGNIGRLTLDT
jgi:hypothetical protein